jgi:L,D-transpeptidase YcbB
MEGPTEPLNSRGIPENDFGRLRSVLVGLLGLGVLGTGCAESGPPEVSAGEAIVAMLAMADTDSIVHLSDGDTLRVSAETMEFYRARPGRAAWVDDDRLLDRGVEVYESIGRAWEDGLPPLRYRHDVATALLGGLGTGDRAALPDSLVSLRVADLDLLLTEGFHRFARDLMEGRLDPGDAGLDYRIPSGSRLQPDLLERVLAGDAPSALVEELRPSVPHYERMRRALLGLYEAEARGGWEPFAVDTTLREGDRGEAVARLRQRLASGLDEEEAAWARTGQDVSLFDADLTRAVQRFQDRHSIEPDGVVGGGTVRELGRSLPELIQELQLNLDRWRWLPNDLGERFVLVNIAGFELEVVEGGRVIESMDVVVGDIETATPVFADSIQYVVVNPYWNIPDGIMERTIQPEMDRDPDYLERNNMEMVNGRVRQRPGPANALGHYKFMFPNEFDVYLHDSPEGHLFARTQRAFSAGCVRIERPRDFAALLLALQSDKDPDVLDELRSTGDEHWIALDRPLPIYLLYFTAWVQEDGTLRFHHDVYGHDEALDSVAGGP